MGVLLLALALGITFSAPTLAVSPEEQLSDPILEDRARGLSQQLRCLVCQNQSIDDSDADLARDLRQEVRTQLQSGKNDAEILEAIRNQYGDYVLLKPPVQTSTYLLWAMPVILIVLALLLFWLQRRGQTVSTENEVPVSEVVSTETAEGTSLSNLHVGLGFGLIILVSLFAYSQLGRPDITAKPLADRGDAIAQANKVASIRQQNANNALADAKAEATANPSSVDAQLLLAMTAARANDFDTEQSALDMALTLTNGDLGILSMKAEALSREAGGLVTLPARDLIAEILSKNPQEPRALYLSGLAAFQDERFEEAVDFWTKLQTVSTADAPWHQMLAENIAQAAQAAGIPIETPTGPDAEMLAAAADMSAEDRQDMILSMVSSLEERLAEEPNDPAGWERLIQSRRVLNDTDGLMRALHSAAQVFSDDKSYQLALLEAILQTETPEPHLNFADDALANLQNIDPNALEYLFFRGHFANVKGEVDTALTAWRTLQDRLPDDVPFAERLAAQIEALESKK